MVFKKQWLSLEWVPELLLNFTTFRRQGTPADPDSLVLSLCLAPNTGRIFKLLLPVSELLPRQLLPTARVQLLHNPDKGTPRKITG